MPIIPTVKEESFRSVSSPVPVGSENIGGSTSTAIANFGTAIETGGAAVLAHERALDLQQQKVSQMEGENDLQNAYRQSTDIAQRAAAPDGSDLAQKFADAYQPMRDKILSRYQDQPEVSKAMTSFSTRVQSDADTNNFITKNQMLEKSNYGRLENVVTTSGDRIRETPNPGMVSAEIKTFTTQLDSMAGTMTAGNADKIRSVFMRTAANQYVTGLAERGQYGVALNTLRANQEDPDLQTKMPPADAQKLGLITGAEAQALTAQGKTFDLPVLTKNHKAPLTPELTRALQDMDPDEKARYIDHFRAKVQEQVQTRLSDINASVEGYERIAQAGQLPPGSDQQRGQLLEQINSSPNLTLPAKMRLYDRLNSAGAVNAQVALAASLPQDQWGKVLDGFDQKVAAGAQKAAATDPRMAAMNSDFAVQGNRVMQKARLEMALNNLALERTQDPAGFKLGTDKQLATAYQGTKDGDPEWSQKYAGQMLRAQSYLQMPHGILPDADAKGQAASLRAAPDADTTNVILSKLQNQWGPYFPQVLKDIAGKDKELQALGVAAYAPPETRTDLLDAIKNRKAILDQAKARSVDWETDKKSLELQVNNRMALFDAAVVGSGDDSQRLQSSQMFREAMTLQARREFARGASPVEAAGRAYSDLLERQYAMEGSSGARVIVPRYLPTTDGRQRPWDTSLVSSFISANTSPGAFKDLGVAVPKLASAPDNFYQTLNARWVTTPDQGGIQLMQVTPEGRMQPVFDKYQKPIRKQYSELEHDPGARTLSVRSSFLGRMFGGR